MSGHVIIINEVDIIDSLSPKINIHILLSVIHRFLKVRRICLDIKTIHYLATTCIFFFLIICVLYEVGNIVSRQLHEMASHQNMR